MLKAMAIKMNKVFIKMAHLWPEKLPTNLDDLTRFIDEVLEVNNLPKDPTYEHALAATIMHLGPLTNRKSKRYFAKSVHKQIANQVAFQKIEQIKKIEKEKLEATIKKEVTPPSVTHDESVQTASGQVVS